MISTVLFLIIVCINCVSAEEPLIPNIIFMMADDMGMGDTSAYQDFTGNADDVQIHTPQMEKLARLGMRFTDAHTPSSRCSPTRYGLLTGRYPWRNRLKFWVLYGSQGDPMIERDRPTLGTLLKSQGYVTAIAGKWHVGLRYRRSDGKPADGFQDADFKQPMYDTPLDHGFDFVRITSRSHGTSGPNPFKKKKPKTNTVGPGHIHGRTIIGATDNGKELVKKGPKAYTLHDLGRRHSESVMEFLNNHVKDADTKNKPFFVYYPSNSNHAPYTPSDEIGGVKVKGASMTKSGTKMDLRHDYVYENDVALGRLINWLQKTDDPRNPGKKLFDNTILVFTSDNGAEKNSNIATGPFRSNKGSVFEGGHRVPFIISWPAKIKAGLTNPAPINLIDMFATFAEVTGAVLPDPFKGEKGGEDSFSIVKALKGDTLSGRPPMFYHDHKDSKGDNAVSALRLDNPTVEGKVFKGKWKIFFDPRLLRYGEVNPIQLFNLEKDQWEKTDLLNNPELKPLVDHLCKTSWIHRNSCGHRLVPKAAEMNISLGGAKGSGRESGPGPHTVYLKNTGLEIEFSPADKSQILNYSGGTGIGKDGFVNDGEALLIKFNKDVIVESVAIASKNGTCGGYYQVGSRAPMAIYCIDADIDAKDQSGALSDIGVVRKGEVLRLDSSPHYGTEAAGKWKLMKLNIRLLK